MASSLVKVWLLGAILRDARAKWVEGRIDTKDDWAFLARFCFLSLEGQFEYLIEYDKDMGTPNLLLYYDDDKQWPAVYHSSKSCKDREAVLNKAGQNQIIKLSHWYPDTEYSGCILTQANKELPASKSTTTAKPATKNSNRPAKNSTKLQPPLDPNYYNQFLKTTTAEPKSTTADVNSTTWYEVVPTDDLNFTTMMPEEELWESIGPGNGTQFGNLKDVEILFGNQSEGTHKIKRSTSEIFERFRHRRLNAETPNRIGKSEKTERMVVTCHNSRRFRSARERWWFIAISNCDSTKGLDVRYKFLMTNGPEGDFWHEHFSADEFYVLPVLLAYTFAYIILMVAAVMCSVELRSRHLLHATYKLFLMSAAAQHAGAMMQALASIRYAATGVRLNGLNTTGQFLCSVAETTFLLLLILMAKGYTITRGRLKVGFTVRLTIFMCCYIVTYMVLFIYQAKAFDPGEVLYLYESPAGYGLIVLRVLAWCMFAYSTFFTVRKYPEKYQLQKLPARYYIDMASSLVKVWLLGAILREARAKWVEGRIDTKDDWAFLARFCFLSLEGQFEYLIEYDKDMGTPNLLLYYDDDKQWPAVYHSSKSCKEREAVLNKAGQNQIIKLSHWYPDTEYSGCILTQANKELPASKSTTTAKPVTKNSNSPTKNSTKLQPPLDPNYYNQFLKTTTAKPKSTTADVNSTTWYEVVPTDDLNFTTMMPEEELWESIGPGNGTQFGNLKDVEILFGNQSEGTHKIKRSTSEIFERFRHRRLNAETPNRIGKSEKTERMVVTCHNSRRFRSARERWWFIAISNCDSTKGLDVRYKFLMTNGPDGDFWHEHFSADEFYVLPVLLAYTFAYIILMVAAVMCSVELRSRHLLHATYKLFLMSAAAQHAGAMMQALASIRYAATGVRLNGLNTTGQFLCSVAETSFLLLLILMAKGYTITRGRLKVGFTVRLTIFMCCYIVTYMVLFIYQAKAFDPGEVLYLYESPAGYGLIVLRVLAWCMFAYSTFFTVRKYPEKNAFYAPFFICGTLWFFAGPLFILTANSYIDKWVRESVVIAVLMFITFSGHIMFLMLTLPVFANKNFPYHVRTTQIGVMEVTGSSALDGFGPNPYHPTNGAAQTVIIPLTRRTEELIGNMYSQYMASAPPLSMENGTPKLNGIPKNIDSISQNGLLKQGSTETNASDDIKPILNDNKEIFTVESQMAKIETVLPQPAERALLPHENGLPKNGEISRGDLPNVLRSRRNILEPLKDPPVPTWSLAKGPCVVAMQKKIVNTEEEPDQKVTLPNGKKVPPVRNGLHLRAGEISTIHEGRVQTYSRTVDLFNASSGNG